MTRPAAFSRTATVRRLGLAASLALAWAAGWGGAALGGSAGQPSKLRIEISFPVDAHKEPITGRIYVMISRRGEPEPRFQTGRTGVPFFGRDVERLKPGEAATIDESDLGSPVPSLRDIPPGEYYVQGFVNVYSEFRRADGHVVWMHDDRWEGQQWRRSPGNLYSDVIRVRVDPTAGGVITLSAKNVIPPVEIPPDTEWLNAPLGFQVGNDLYREWTRDDFPRMIVVTFQHPTPYFDDSYAVNSVNVGPYGDALTQELIPEVEKRYRVIREPWARLLDGGSTGGWEALALQLFYPDLFGGTWAYCPDPVTFTDVEGINVYEDVNAFYKQHEWRRVPTPNTRETDGRIRLTSEQRNHFERDMDNFYLNNAVRELEAWMKTTQNPHYRGFFMYGDGRGHCWSGPVSTPERLREMAQFMLRKKPEGATTAWWKY